MKKKCLFIALAILGVCGGITASQGDVQVLSEECDCCVGSKNTSCYAYYGYEVISCGRGTNICDMAPPPEM